MLLNGIVTGIETQLRRARDLIDHDFRDPELDLDRMAAAANLSRSYFVRRFSRQFGVTPGAHLTARRIERAKDLLRFANLTVTEVCTTVGYSSLGSFSSAFLASTGENPSVFQQRWGAREKPRIPGCEILMRGS